MNNIKLIFIGLLILNSGTIYGQTNRFDIGIEGSPGLTFLRGNDFIDKYHNTTMSFSGGFFFQFNFKKIISLHTNIAYERKGSITTAQATNMYGNSIGEVTINTNFDYLTIPILLRATFGKKVQFFVNGGPYFGYLLKNTFVSKGDNIPRTTGDNTKFNKRFDTGISTGLGLSVPVKTRFAVSFEIRNNLGLYNVSAGPVVNNGTIKTNSTNFLFGFIYRLGLR
ncbi:MAG: porin family protein [Bacteroidota bacterium]|nr:porin family protein [Bacteroidota bacterium]